MRASKRKSIAIIGMAGRFPNAPDLRKFWENLEQGLESLQTLSDAELLESGVAAELLQSPNYVKKGSFLEHSDLFDAAFFGYNPREAEAMDPQQRVFLEAAWHALEDAGHSTDASSIVTGVFAGLSMNSYLLNNILKNPAAIEAVGAYQVMIGNDKDFLATRVSYKLNLTGPSFTLQTACSTSLVAVQLACQSLLQNDCDMALAGGISLHFPQKTGHLYTEGMILSPDGRCRPFDAQAGGIRAGEGVGIVVLKRLEDALRDGDCIRAVILGTAVNNDGADKMGYTAPSVDGQANAIAAAIEKAGIDPASISYVEAHGTGTRVGDPIEIAALQHAFSRPGDKKQFCAIGSVKSNIGHLDAAAGVAGLIKTVLALQNKRIPPTVAFEQPNPLIDFANSPFFVSSKLSEWTSDGSPRRAGVSSFGIGGTNAHVVVEEAPEQSASAISWPSQLVVLSAKSGPALDALTNCLREHLASNPSISLADACYTLQVGRRRFPHRRMLVCNSREELISALSSRAAGIVTRMEEATARPLTFMFSGQGSQHVGMARGLYQTQPTFGHEFDACADYLKPLLGCDLREVLYSPGADPSVLNETRLAQPLLFATEYAMARMWMSWGVVPDSMMGHSIGEYVAACLAEVFSLEDALSLVAARGRIMQSMPAGSMLAVPLSEKELAGLLNENVSLAAVNAPGLCTVSGPSDAIAAWRSALQSRGIECRPIHTSHAFHSKMMDAALAPFSESARSVKFSQPRFPFISNVSGTWIRPEEAADASYWAAHLRNPVRFANGISELAKAPDRVFLEVGPGQVLTTFARECTRGNSRCESVASLPHAKDNQPDVSFILNTVGKLWVAGVRVDWAGLHEGEKLHRVSLPTYPFERQRYYVQPQAAAKSEQASKALERKELADWFYVPSWTRSVFPSAVASAGESYGPWLIFRDEGGIGDRAANVLASRGEKSATVSSGSAFARVGEFEYTINPERPEDYATLLQALTAAGSMPSSVLHLWGLSDALPGGARAAFRSLMFFAQAIGTIAYEGHLECIVASAGLHNVNGREKVNLDSSILLGPAKVIPTEYPNIACRCVDLPSASLDDENLDSLVTELLFEPALPHASRAIAYRDAYRWVQTFTPVRVAQSESPLVKTRGVYLITGGTGGIGLTLASYLAENYQARLALVSRTPLPARAEWPKLLNNPDDSDAIARIVRAVKKLEDSGGEVLVLAADVCDRAAMSRAIAETKTRFGLINGVVHAAGIAGGGLIQLKVAGSADGVLAPKVDGTLVLDSVLDTASLDFFVLCSSINALCGVAGQADYTGANAFLDAFAASRYHGGRARVISINWDTWQQVGMAVKTAIPSAMAESRREFLNAGITPDEGVDAFCRALNAGQPQIAVITHDLNRILEEADRRRLAMAQPRAPSIPVANNSRVAPQHSRPNLQSSFVPAETETEIKIVAIWGELLGIDEIGIEDNFFELGGHSLLATGILARVRNIFGVTVPLNKIFEAPTVRLLSNHVDTVLWASTSQVSNATDSDDREEVEL